MKVLVDTPIWSLAFRRATIKSRNAETDLLRHLIEDYRAAIIGPIRQEVLSGIRDEKQFERLRDLLRAFPDVPIKTSDYETAASFFNRCRTAGIQGSHTDFLICAVAAANEYPIFTTDADFSNYARVLPISAFESGII